MKKLVMMLVTLVLLVSLCGCNAVTDTPTNEETNKTETVATPEPTAEPTVEPTVEPTATPEPEKTGKKPEPGTALSTFYQAVIDMQPADADPLIMFEENNPGLIGSFYPGLDAIELSQEAYYMPPIATHPCEIVLVEVANSTDVRKVADIFQARIDNGADDTTYPESAAGWAKFAQVHKSGNFVCMIVLPEGYVIPENVFEMQ